MNALDGGAVLSAPSTVASLLPSVSFLPQAAKWLELPCSSAAAALLLEDELLLLRSRKMPIAAATATVSTVSLSIVQGLCSAMEEDRETQFLLEKGK
jgi:hypothetical protein